MSWDSLLLEKLGHRANIPAVVAYAQANPRLVDTLTSELNQAISLYNDYVRGNLDLPPGISSSMLKNANQLKQIANTELLPTTDFPFKEEDDSKDTDYWQLMNNFDFIDEPWEPSKMLAALAIASYRSDMLATYPAWHRQGAQIASTLEEMLTIMAARGNRTHIFQATQHWIQDFAGEDFDVKLSELVATL